MYQETTIRHDGTLYIIVGKKETTAHCDGCDEMIEDRSINVLREQATPYITFWCNNCLADVRAHQGD